MSILIQIRIYLERIVCNFTYVVGIDPGVAGGLTILKGDGKIDVYKMPVERVIVNKKEKKIYDCKKIVEILKFLSHEKVLFVQEKVGVMPGEGAVSSFSFGRSSGLTIGIAYAMGFDVVEVSPVVWKKYYPELITEGISEKKEQIKCLKDESKRIKDKEDKKRNKKDIEKINRQIKSDAKDASRFLAVKLYPEISDFVQKKNCDGVAESALIAKYGKDNQNELV